MNYFLIGTAIIGSLIIYTFTGANLLSSYKAKKMIASGEIDIIIDVRTSTEYSFGNYINSINIPVQSFSKDKFKNFNKNKTYLVYCNTGQRARRASELLKQFGFKKVYYIAGHYTSLN